jgi:hypothetical protein
MMSPQRPATLPSLAPKHDQPTTGSKFVTLAEEGSVESWATWAGCTLGAAEESTAPQTRRCRNQPTPTTGRKRASVRRQPLFPARMRR